MENIKNINLINKLHFLLSLQFKIYEFMAENIKEQKIALRRLIRQRKKMFSQEQLQQKSQKICEKLQQLLDNINYKHIMLYYPLPDEVDVRPLFDRIQANKCLILPTVLGDDIVPVSFTKDSTFKEGAFHILEPQNDCYNGPIDVILVPGMAFDKKGNRLGRGKGYYDRFLQQHLQTSTIGVCFDFQLLDVVPSEDFDKKVDCVIY